MSPQFIPKPPPVTTPCGKKIQHRPMNYDDALIRLNEHLTKANLKHSSVREQVLSVISKYPGHFSVYDLCHKVAETFPDIGKATVYRVIGLFLEANILREGPSRADGLALYELAELNDSEHHDHIVCLDCGAVFEFHDPAIETKQLAVAKGMAFEPQYHRHVIYAQCLKNKQPK